MLKCIQLGMWVDSFTLVWMIGFHRCGSKEFLGWFFWLVGVYTLDFVVLLGWFAWQCHLVFFEPRVFGILPKFGMCEGTVFPSTLGAPGSLFRVFMDFGIKNPSRATWIPTPCPGLGWLGLLEIPVLKGMGGMGIGCPVAGCPNCPNGWARIIPIPRILDRGVRAGMLWRESHCVGIW